jgi:hypothetical protein
MKHCPCACHREHHDGFFSCGLCYAANHMPAYARRAERLSDTARALAELAKDVNKL